MTLALILALTFCSPRADCAVADNADPVAAALDRAKAWLYEKQKDGHWEEGPPPGVGPELKNDNAQSHNGGNYTGLTAAATYALLAAGESHQDARLRSAIEFLKKTETRGTYALGLRMQVWLLLPPTPDVKQAAKRDAAILLGSMKTKGEAKGFYDYVPGPSESYSHSRSQYGVLGIWAAQQMGLEISRAYWQTVENAWIEHQDPSGGWTYKLKTPHPLTPGMTAAGVATLFITQDYLHADAGLVCKGNIRNPAIDKGIAWIVANMNQVASDQSYPRDFPYVTLYAIERVGVASGLKYLGTIDWYKHGEAWLLKTQGKSGSWQATSSIHQIANTSFAMLFLTRGRAPVAINKLEYADPEGKAGNWNQRPRDVANFARWLGRTVEKDINWQTVNLKVPVQDLHDAPILYLSGNEELKFSDEHKKKLKAFVEQGGLILGTADCGGKGFANSFRQLGAGLFPPYEFRELPDDHVLYRNQFNRDKWKSKPSVLGLSNGAREFMLLIPTADMGKAWQIANVAGREEMWQFPANLFFYVTDHEQPKFKGQTHLVIANPTTNPAKKLALARLQYSGNWDPEPGGWQRLAAVMRNRHSLDLSVAPKKLAADKLDDVKIAHLTGTTTFRFTDDARADVKKFVEAGGTLVIDATGGSTEFANAAEAEIAAMFPQNKLAALPVDHAVYSAGGKKLEAVAYRAFASRAVVGTSKQPRLQGVTVNGRTAIYFSREDLSVGLVGQTVDGILGYTPESAAELMARILLSAVQ